MVRPYLSVVAPCFNEAETIQEFCRRVRAACEATGHSFEIVLVNDGSSDQTWEKMTAICRADPRVVAVNLSRNHGHQLALTAGLSFCRGQRILIIDADLQDPPELLPQMLRTMDEQQADVVYGQRRRREGESWFKLATASAFYRLIRRITDVPIPPDTGDFRLITRRALDLLQAMPERHRFIRGMVSWIGFRQVPLLYDRCPRFAGRSKYPFGKMLRFAMDAVTAFSVRPLQWASLVGLFMACFAAALLVYSLVSWLLFHTVSGWTSLMAAIALVGGTQLLVLGVMGEYLGRIYDQVKGRPLFIVQEVVRTAPQQSQDDGPSFHSGGNMSQTSRAEAPVDSNLRRCCGDSKPSSHSGGEASEAAVVEPSGPSSPDTNSIRTCG
ncbi:glycosyltransferase family 2 protein [Fontivita pretiosa]|uniref:glycosyltransferase family 2 protein n=1 Tax=Fontivita pretiosa TaxID=2989684 RepID=UPI003D18614E